MDSQHLLASALHQLGAGGASEPPGSRSDHLVPYVILIINCLLFQLARSLANKLLAERFVKETPAPKAAKSGRLRLMRLFAHELISTCELCADCAELNVVYEKHGSLAYGASLALLTYLWTDSFGEAHTSPGYLFEELAVGPGPRLLLATGDTYARFIGQSLAMPIAWRLASVYWKYELLREHRNMADVANCKSSLATSALNGFAIELVCCLLCRLAELVGQKLLERQLISQRVLSAACAFLCSLLVVLALELSGGYFNPILAGALEFGCQGASLHQHALVFWLGPLLGHLFARLLFKRYASQLLDAAGAATSEPPVGAAAPSKRQQAGVADGQEARRQLRSSQRRRKSDKLD